MNPLQNYNNIANIQNKNIKNKAPYYYLRIRQEWGVCKLNSEFLGLKTCIFANKRPIGWKNRENRPFCKPLKISTFRFLYNLCFCESIALRLPKMVFERVKDGFWACQRWPLVGSKWPFDEQKIEKQVKRKHLEATQSHILHFPNARRQKTVDKDLSEFLVAF